MSNFHLDHADDRLDAATLRAAELQNTIDRLAVAVAGFPIDDLRPGTPALAGVVAAIRRARAILSESGDNCSNRLDSDGFTVDLEQRF